jgi:hypothetical protein
MRSALVLLAIVGPAAADTPKPVNLLSAVPAVVAVSSTVDNRAILPEHLVDGKLETAWNSRTNQLVGAWIGVRLPADVKVETIKLTVGFTKKDKKLGDLFTMNPRITRVRILKDGKVLAEKALDPEMRSLQEIAVAGGGGDYKIEVTDIVPGTKKTWREISISELQVWGTTTKPAPKPQKPVVRVGSFEPPTVLTRAECMKVMFPKARGNRIGPEPDDEKVVGFSALALGGDIDICRVDHVDDAGTSTTAELAAVRRTPRLAVIQRIDTLQVASEIKDKDAGEGTESTVDLERFPLTTTETGLLVHETDRKFGPMMDDGKTKSTLYRVTSTSMTPILTYESTWSAGEADDADRCTLQPPVLGTSLPALTMQCVKSEGRWHGQDPRGDGLHTEERTLKFRWKGTSYEEK